MVKKINLQTHDGSENYLEHIEDNKYKLVTEIPSIGGGYTNDGARFIDPSGGPMIAKGHPLECYLKPAPIVEDFEFENGVIVTLKFK